VAEVAARPAEVVAEAAAEGGNARKNTGSLLNGAYQMTLDDVQGSIEDRKTIY